MSITIHWTNDYAGQEDEIRVYRDIIPINPLSPPTALATLPIGSNVYVDTSAGIGITYYYRLSVVYQGTEIFGTVDEVVTNSEWTPAELFLGSENGFWLDASDVSTIESFNSPITGTPNQTVIGHKFKGALSTTNGYVFEGNSRFQSLANGRYKRFSNGIGSIIPSEDINNTGIDTQNWNPSSIALINNSTNILIGMVLNAVVGFNEDIFSAHWETGGQTLFKVISRHDSALEIQARQQPSDPLMGKIIAGNVTENFPANFNNQIFIFSWDTATKQIEVYVNNILVDTVSLSASGVAQIPDEDADRITIGDQTFSAYQQIVLCGRNGTITPQDHQNLYNYLAKARYRGV